MTEEELAAKPIGAQVHIRFPNQRFVWNFTRTTESSWKRSTRGMNAAWATHGHLAYLITEGQQTNSLGEPL